jgi:hypothetical protein
MFVPLRWRDAELLHQISHLGHVQHGVEGSRERATPSPWGEGVDPCRLPRGPLVMAA